MTKSDYNRKVKKDNIQFTIGQILRCVNKKKINDFLQCAVSAQLTQVQHFIDSIVVAARHAKFLRYAMTSDCKPGQQTSVPYNPENFYQKIFGCLSDCQTLEQNHYIFENVEFYHLSFHGCLILLENLQTLRLLIEIFVETRVNEQKKALTHNLFA